MTIEVNGVPNDPRETITGELLTLVPTKSGDIKRADWSVLVNYEGAFTRFQRQARESLVVLFQSIKD